MWRLCKLGFRHEPRADAGVSFILALLAALPDALLAVWLKLLGDGVISRNAGAAAAARSSRLGVSPVATWFLQRGEHAGAAAVPRQGDDRP